MEKVNLGIEPRTAGLKVRTKLGWNGQKVNKSFQKFPKNIKNCAKSGHTASYRSHSIWMRFLWEKHFCKTLKSLNGRQSYPFNVKVFRGAAIAQWICLHLPSCRPVFKSQTLHLCFYHLSPTILPPWVWVPSTPSMLLSYMVFVLYLSCEKNENKQKKRPGLAHFNQKQ